MPNWKGNNPPVWQTNVGLDAVAKSTGWVNPETGETIITARNLHTVMGAADVIQTHFVAASLQQGDALSVKVKFNELVDVSAGASVVVSSTGLAGSVTLYALAQSGIHDVLFDKDVTLVSAALVPSEAATLSIAAQSLVGTIKDAGTAVDSNKAIGAEAAAHAGTRVVA